MNIKALVILVVALTAAADAAQKLDVFVYNGERVPFETLKRAEALASGVFATADVRIAWHGAPRSGWKGQSRVIIIQLEMTTAVVYRVGALGYSLAYEGVHASLFYDRIRQMNQQNLESPLLGHAMVHEITHLLQGISRHSATGVMKARWDSGDYLEMKRHLLSFTSEDIQMIRNAEHRPVTPAAKVP
jgi:hypothetical protein